MLGPQNGTYGPLLKVLKLQRLCAGVLDKRPTQNRMQTLFSVLDADSHLKATKLYCVSQVKNSRTYMRVRTNVWTEVKNYLWQLLNLYDDSFGGTPCSLARTFP
jgi:hypothetical protein